MIRFSIAVNAGVLAFMAAFDCGLPMWRNWPPGDAADFGAFTFSLVWGLLYLAMSRPNQATKGDDQ